MLFIDSNLSCDNIETGEIGRYIGQRVKVHGMVHKIRRMSGFAFVILRTSGGLLQCVYSPQQADFRLEALEENMGVAAWGTVHAEPRSRSGAELRLESFEALSRPACPPPVVVNGKEPECSLETLLDYRPLTLRNPSQSAIFALQSGICRGVRDFLDRSGFTEIHSPKIVFGGAEGGANIFSLDYFGRQAFLAQSPQFYKQMMMGVFERVYEIAPVFRAEKHDTSRHLNEYISVDLEMAFIESFYDLCRMETAMLKHLFDFLRENYSREIGLTGAVIPTVEQIPAIGFCQAKELISKTYGREITDKQDMEPEEERLLCEIIKAETGCDFVFVTHYKSSKRPFYAMDCKENPQLTESFDLLFRGTEVTTGGQRINDYAMQVEKLRDRGMNPNDFSDFLMAHKYGLPPHGGLGLGLERLTAGLLGFSNIRRASLFPRDASRLTP